MFPQHDQLVFKSQLWSSVFHHTFILLLLTDIATGQSQAGTTSQTITTVVGEDVILPCHLEPALDAVSKSVEWRRLDLDPTYVHVWNEGQNHLTEQNPSFKGRTTLSTEKLRRGDLSLKLSGVKHSDSGTYTCYFPSESKESIVELTVSMGCPPCSYTYDAINLALIVFCDVFLCIGGIFIVYIYKKAKINEELNMFAEIIDVMLELKKDHLQDKEEFKQLEETNKKLTENKENLHLVENDIAKSEKERETDKTERYLEEKQSLLTAQRKLEKRKEELENLQLDMKSRQLQQIDNIMSKLRERKRK